MAGPNDLCETRGVERTVTEISANTASVIGHPIVAAVPVTELGPRRRLRRRLPGGARILAFCEGDVVVLRSSVLSPTLPGAIVDRHRVSPERVVIQPGFGAVPSSHVLTVGTERWSIDSVHAEELERRLDAAGWISGDARRLAA